MADRKKPSLLIVGHTYATAFNRRKLNPLADYFDIVCVTWRLEGSVLFGRPLSDFEQDDHAPRYSLVRLPILFKAKGTTRYLMLGLARVIRQRRFDIVLADSEPWGLVRWQAWGLTRLFQKNALFGEFSWENIERPGPKGLLLSLVYKLAVRSGNFSISGNTACRQILLRHGAAPESNLVAAQLGVEAEEFKPSGESEKRDLRRELGLPEEGFLIGFCGRYTETKGVRELLNAVNSLKKRLPHRGIQLAMLGHGELGAELAQFSEKNPWLHLLSARPHKEVAVFMRCLDMFILPSKPRHSGPNLWEEQFGHVLIEAMAAAVATLGSSSGAIPEVIGHPNAIFPHSDSEALTSAMEYWLIHPEDRENLARSQREFTLATYTHEALAKIWGEFLLERLAYRQKESSV